MDTKALRDLSYGVYVISTLNDGKPAGCVANSAMQITSSPATIAVSLNHNNFTNECVEKCGYFTVTILSEKSNPEIIGTFGFNSSKDMDKFSGFKHDFLDGIPYLTDSCGVLKCKVIDKMETSTHTVFLAEIEDTLKLESVPAMTYAYYHNVVKGKRPANAPTYIPEEKASDSGSKNRFVCSVCGYVYETDEDVLPADFTCPICKVGSDKFEKE